MEWLNTLFFEYSVVQAIIVISLVASVGLLLNKISLKGISLGVTFVFFTGILAGHYGFGLDKKMLEYAESFGLVLFIYALGLQVGPGFSGSFRKGGLCLNLFAFVVVLLGSFLTLGFHYAFDVSLPNMMGILSGAVTNTPALGAAQQTLKMLNVEYTDPALGCAVTYPLGVVGVIFGLALLHFIFKKRIRKEPVSRDKAKNTFIAEFIVENPGISQRSIREIASFTANKFVISRLWRAGKLIIPTSDTLIEKNDRLLIVTEKNDVEALSALFGRQGAMDWNKEGIDWNAIDSNLISRKMIVTKRELNGEKLGMLKLRTLYGVNVTRIFRAGVELLPSSDFVLQFGDKLIMVGEKAALDKVSDFLGNRYKELNEPNLVAIFIGMLSGLVVGSIPFAIPGISVPVKIGLAGGPMIMGILIGGFGPRFKVVTYTTRGANLMLQRLGLTLYLACLGISAGEHFFATVFRPEGLLWLCLGFMITVIPISVVGGLALKFTRMNFAEVSGMVCGSMSNPMALNYVNGVTDGERAAVAYATVYPMTMFLRVIITQLLLVIFV